MMNTAMAALFGVASWSAYRLLAGAVAMESAGAVWRVAVYFALILAGILIAVAHFTLASTYRRVLQLKSITFVLYAATIDGIGYVGYDAWSRLYNAQPAGATLLALVVAVVPYGFGDIVFVFFRILLVKDMAALTNTKELPALSEEGQYRAGIHEAGHAICYGLCKGVPEDAYVVIDQNMNELIGGKVNLPVPREPTDFSRPHIEWELLMLMAGVAAEEVVFGEGSMLGAGDMSALNTNGAIYLMAGHGDVYEMHPDDERDVEGQPRRHQAATGGIQGIGQGIHHGQSRIGRVDRTGPGEDQLHGVRQYCRPRQIGGQACRIQNGILAGLGGAFLGRGA